MAPEFAQTNKKQIKENKYIMYPTFTVSIRTFSRVICVILAALLFVVGLPLLKPDNVAADQFSRRSIQLSDASPSGSTITTGVGSGTNVSYQVTLHNAQQAGSMVIDFCQQDPIIGDTCTAPAGMSAPSAVAMAAGTSGTIGGTGWTLDASGSGQVKLKDDGVAAHNAQPGATQIFDVTFATNPSTVGTFYARMYSYCDNTYGSTTCVNAAPGTTPGAYASATSPGGYVDYGGIALSINNTITITARVQESLTFCVTKAAPGTWTTHDCSDPVVSLPANLPDLIIGHGSPTAVLDANSVDTGDIYSQLSTNATNGAVINLHNSNTICGGLSADNGATCAIPPINSGSGAGPTAMAAGTAAFGMVVFPSIADASGGIGSIAPTTAYYTNSTNDPEDPALLASSTSAPTNTTSTVEKADYFDMDATSTSAANSAPSSSYSGAVNSTYGSTIAASTGPAYRVENHYTFGATSALTTPAGIYTANLSMIATGTF